MPTLGPGQMTPLNHRLLCEAITAARVALGAYDHHVVQGLARLEPETCAVIAGLIECAYQAGEVSRGR
jgi:hypothetical protein